MNRFEGNFGSGTEARLRYLQNDYSVIRPGSHVLCGVTGARIPLEELRYWNAERQEAYASAEIAAARYDQLRGSATGD